MRNIIPGKDIRVAGAGAEIWRSALTHPFRTALGQHDILENVLFRIELSDGTRGFGEAAVATHITGETVAGTYRRLKRAAAEIKGKRFADPRGFCGIFFGGRENNSCARAAVETAVLDAYTRRQGIPLWRYFGGRCGLLRTDMTIVIGPAGTAARSAASYYRKGFGAFKVKIGRDMDADIRRTVAVFRAAPKAALLIDANQGYRAAQILHFLKEIARLGIRPVLVEQPVPRDDWEGLREVARKSRVPVCADESVRSVKDAKKIIRGRYAQVLNIKLMKSGIFESMEIARLARAAGLRLMIGQMMETPLAAVAAAHLASGLGGFEFADLDTPFFIDGSVTRGRWWDERGVYDLRGVRAGIGVIPVPRRRDPQDLASGTETNRGSVPR